MKYDRNGFKARPRNLVLTQTTLYVIEQVKIKQKIEYTNVKGKGNTCFKSPSDYKRNKVIVLYSKENLHPATTTLQYYTV